MLRLDHAFEMGLTRAVAYWRDNERLTMLTPRYFFHHDFTEFEQLFRERAGLKRTFSKGEILWFPGECIERVYYLESGLVKTVLVGEDGINKTIFFHGSGSVFPGCHEARFDIERSLVSTAMAPVTAYELPIHEAQALLRESVDLARAMLEAYAAYTNLLIYGSAQQGRSDGLSNLCDLLLLLARSMGGADRPSFRIDFTQEELAELLGMNRVSVARLIGTLRDEGVLATYRGGIEIRDLHRLAAHCSASALGETGTELHRLCRTGGNTE